MAELRDAGLVANGTRRCSRGRWPRTRTGLNEAGYNKHGKPVKDSVSQELDGSAGVLARGDAFLGSAGVLACPPSA